MKGTLVGVSVFLLLSFSVAIAAVGAVSQAFGGSTSAGVSGLAVAQYDSIPENADGQDQSGVYQAFTYVCPFH
jgi:hypothetical protein